MTFLRSRFSIPVLPWLGPRRSRETKEKPGRSTSESHFNAACRLIESRKATCRIGISVDEVRFIRMLC